MVFFLNEMKNSESIERAAKVFSSETVGISTSRFKKES